MTRQKETLFLLVLVLYLMASICGCDIAGSEINRTEVKRATSPGSKYDLVFYEVSGGVAVDTFNEMYVMRVGEKDRERGILIVKILYPFPMDVSWEKDKDDAEVKIKVGDKKVVDFTNYAFVPSFNDKVHFVLQ